MDKAKKALDERQDDSPFKLGRLPALKKKLSQNLEENKPRLDVDAARRSISTFLRTVLVGPSQVSEGLLSLKHEDDTGKVSVTLNAQHIVGVCLRKLSVNFTTLKSNQDLEKKVIEKAVAVQETETCHTTRQRIYKQMNRYAEALDKLVKMHCDVSSSEAPPDSKSILVRWWPEDALTVAKDDSWGDDETDNTKFKSEKCNWVQAAMKEKKWKNHEHSPLATLPIGCQTGCTSSRKARGFDTASSKAAARLPHYWLVATPGATQIAGLN